MCAHKGIASKEPVICVRSDHSLMSLSQPEVCSCEPQSGDNSGLPVAVGNILLKGFICKDLFLVLAEQRRGKEPSSPRRGFGTASTSGTGINYIQRVVFSSATENKAL